MTEQELIDFEKEVADIYCDGKIRAPIHLSDGNERQLIEVFKMIKRSDWVFSNWRSHYHALLHGIPPEFIKEKILAGDSITLCFPEYRFLTSAIVSGVLPIAMGTAWAVKKKGEDYHVWCFLGDMTYMTGVAHEVIKYATNFDLPITFVVEDNTQSVGTPSYVVWGLEDRKPSSTMPVQIGPKVWKYDYIKTWPHVGAGKFVTF
jgi:pyruvate dehydrogenase E1 component alpha subunit